MYFKIISLCFFVSSSLTDPGTNDDPMCTNEQVFGKDVFCIFTFAGKVKLSKMQCAVPDAKPFTIGKLNHHRLDFANIDGEEGGFPTACPDECEEIWGRLYLAPVSQFEAIVKDFDTFGGPKKLYHSVKKTIEIEKDGQTINVECNAFPAINEPAKEVPLPKCRRPTPDVKELFISGFTEAQFPSDYIEKVKKIPTTTDP